MKPFVIISKQILKLGLVLLCLTMSSTVEKAEAKIMLWPSFTAGASLREGTFLETGFIRGTKLKRSGVEGVKGISGALLLGSHASTLTIGFGNAKVFYILPLYNFILGPSYTKSYFDSDYLGIRCRFTVYFVGSSIGVYWPQNDHQKSEPVLNIGFSFGH